jgi:hypothetical protein
MIALQTDVKSEFDEPGNHLLSESNLDAGTLWWRVPI